MPKFTDSLVGENLEVATEYFKALMAEANTSEDKNSGGSVGFIPFNIHFNMDGISGIKIYDELSFDTSFLPPGYTKTIDFIVTGIDHKLKDGDWETNITVTLIPKTDNINQNQIIKGSVPIQTQQENTAPPPPPLLAPATLATPAAGNLAGLNAYPSVSNTPLLKKALIDQSTYAFTKLARAKNPKNPNDTGFGERTGLCAGMSFNIAYKLKEHIDKQSSTAIPWSYVGSGDADTDAHRSSIKSLGIYDEIYLGEFTGEQLESKNSILRTTKWNYGDIVNYWAPLRTNTDSYMHTQIYTGDIWKTGISGKGILNGAGNSGWSTSGKTNYGDTFIYPRGTLVYRVYAYKIKREYLK